MNAFVLPSRYEGLGLAAIEAQAAGLICVLADTVPPETVVCPELVVRLSLSDPPLKWAEALLRNTPDRQGPSHWRERVRRSPFNIDRSVEALSRIYSAGRNT
jgi:glycosyltransferase involved in cell wall biosynthesis